jgi:hypothetical protein
MAARTRTPAKQGTRRETDVAAADAGTRTAVKSSARKKATAKKAAAKKAAANKMTTAGKAPRKSGQDTKAKAGAAGRGAAGELEMLAEQNAALRAELEHAKARIAQLEALQVDVINRIDWVIDSLQTVLEEKR